MKKIYVISRFSFHKCSEEAKVSVGHANDIRLPLQCTRNRTFGRRAGDLVTERIRHTSWPFSGSQKDLRKIPQLM